MKLIVLLLFLLVWSLCILIIGIPQIYFLLGGTTGLFFLMPVIASICFVYSSLQKVVWSSLLTLGSLIVINGAYSYFFKNPRDLDLLITSYILCIPVALIVSGYSCTLESFVDLRGKTGLKHQDTKFLRYFSVFLLGNSSIAACITIIMVGSFEKLDLIIAMGYQIILGGFMTGCLLFANEARKFPKEASIHLSKLNVKFHCSARHFKTVFAGGILAFLAFSTYWEVFYRKAWVMWGETVVVFIGYIFLLWKFGAEPFLDTTNREIQPDRINIPSVWNRRTIITALISFSLFLLITIYCMFKTMGL